MSAVTGEDTKAAASYRFARGAAIILAVLIVFALIALMLGFAFRSPHPPADASTARHFNLAPGARVVSMDVQPGRLILRTHSQAGDEIDIIDTTDGHLVGQVKSAALPAAK